MGDESSCERMKNKRRRRRGWEGRGETRAEENVGEEETENVV